MRPQPRYQPSDRIADRYHVHDVKMGGMGEVYLCLDLEEMYPYALKTFQQRHQSDSLRQAFETEVATWVALEKHPNIVRCFHMRTLGNLPFMVLEWVSGEPGRGTDLRSHLRYGRMPLNQSLKLILDLCYGLQHAQHKQPGLVHRDLKPENILIAQGGQAKITDFGLAQVVAEVALMPDDEAWLSNPAQTMLSDKGIAGTPSYMAPEQWRGEVLDERTDIYALGCIWVELLTGLPPFRMAYQPTSQKEVARWFSEMQHQHEHAQRSELLADLPDSVIDLIQACLAQAPDERPDSLTDLIDQVQALYIARIGQPPPLPPSSDKMTTSDFNNRGNTYRDLGHFDNALLDYNLAIQLDPSYAPAFNNRGLMYQNLGQLDNALQDYNQAIQLDPNGAIAYCNRGNIYDALGQLDNALLDYNKATHHDPSYAIAYYNRGMTYRALGQFDSAIRDFNQAIHLDPSYANAYTNRGNTYHDLGQLDNALQDYNQAIQLDPNGAIAYYNRGVTHKALGQLDNALQDYNQAIQLDPSYASAYVNLGALLGNQGKHAEALPYFEKSAQLNDPQGAQFAAQARQMLAQDPEPQANPNLIALDAFAQTASLDELRQVVISHPILLEADFVEAIIQALTEIPANQQPAYQQCLTWLQQIIQEQAQ